MCLNKFPSLSWISLPLDPKLLWNLLLHACCIFTSCTGKCLKTLANVLQVLWWCLFSMEGNLKDGFWVLCMRMRFMWLIQQQETNNNDSFYNSKQALQQLFFQHHTQTERMTDWNHAPHLPAMLQCFSTHCHPLPFPSALCSFVPTLSLTAGTMQHHRCTRPPLGWQPQHWVRLAWSVFAAPPTESNQRLYDSKQAEHPTKSDPPTAWNTLLHDWD